MDQAEPFVYVVDDDEQVRVSIEEVLVTAGLKTCAFASAHDFLEAFSSDGVACLVLDVNLPGISGMELQSHLERLDIPLPIVFISAHGDIPMSVRAIKAGAVEFLTKPFRATDLLAAVREALAEAARRCETRTVLKELQSRYGSLTLRQRQVFERVTAGLLNKQVALELGVSEITVKIHRREVMKKMRARSAIDLVRMAELLGRTTDAK